MIGRRWDVPTALAASILVVAGLLVAAVDCRADHVLGIKFFSEGKYAEALEQFEKQIERTPDFHYTRYMTGICHLKMNHPDLAVSALESSMAYAKADKEKFKTLDGLGKAFAGMGRYDEAAARFEAAGSLSVPPEMQAKAHEQCGDIHLRRRHYGEAADELGKAAALLPGDANTQYKLGHARLKLGEYDGAIQALEKAVSLNARDLKWIRKLGDAYLAKTMSSGSDTADQGLYLKGIDLAGKGLALAPSSFEMNDLLGNCYLGVGRYDEAIAVLSKAVRANPDYGYGFYNLAQAHTAKQDYRAAEKALEKAATLMPDNGLVFSSLGFVYEKLNRLEDSIQAYQTASNLKPSAATRDSLSRVAQKIKARELAAAGVPDTGQPGGMDGAIALQGEPSVGRELAR